MVLIALYNKKKDNKDPTIPMIVIGILPNTHSNVIQMLLLQLLSINKKCK